MKLCLCLAALILITSSLDAANAEASNSKTYLCKNFDSTNEVVIIDVSVGTVQTTYLKIKSLKDIKTTADPDIEGFAIKRRVMDTDTYYDLSSYSLRLNEKTNVVTLSNYKSSGATNSDCQPK